MDGELLKISVTLSGTFWNKKPQFSIWLDNNVLIQSEINSNSLQTHSFNHAVQEGLHQLKIRLENKTTEDTLQKDSQIMSDMLLNIEDISINDTSIKNLKWDSVFIPDQPQIYQGKEIKSLPRCVNLGWNGTYILEFSSPYYIWLLEKL